MKLHTVSAFSVFVLGVASPLLGATAPAPRVAAIERAESKLSQMASQTKGAPQHRLLLERQRVRGLLDDLEAGRPVAPEDIDRALQNAERPF